MGKHVLKTSIWARIKCIHDECNFNTKAAKHNCACTDVLLCHSQSAFRKCTQIRWIIHIITYEMKQAFIILPVDVPLNNIY